MKDNEKWKHYMLFRIDCTNTNCIVYWAFKITQRYFTSILPLRKIGWICLRTASTKMPLNCPPWRASLNVSLYGWVMEGSSVNRFPRPYLLSRILILLQVELVYLHIFIHFRDILCCLQLMGLDNVVNLFWSLVTLLIIYCRMSIVGGGLGSLL